MGNRPCSPIGCAFALIGLILVSTACSSGSTSATTVSPGGGSHTRVFGNISAGPTCPVERARHPCPLKPVAGTVAVEVDGTRQVADTRIASNGEYALSLAPGSYSLVVVLNKGGVLPRCPVRNVTIRPGPAVRVNITCDTGIR